MLNPLDIPPTQCGLEYADLPIIDLALCATMEGRLRLAHQVHDALSEAGFFYVLNHGMSIEETKRMFMIADVPFSQVDDDEKAQFTGNIQEGKVYDGYKARQAWHIANGVRDQIELYNINRDVSKQEHPEALRPFLPEISAWARHTHDVLHQLLRLLALGLELPEETFVNLHGFSSEGYTSVRFMKYYPRSDEDEHNSNNVWLKGHTDQHNIARISLFYSCMPNSDVVLAPRLESPVLQRLGVINELQGKDHPTMAEWRNARITSYGQIPLTQQGNGVEEGVVLGKVVKHYQ